MGGCLTGAVVVEVIAVLETVVIAFVVVAKDFVVLEVVIEQEVEKVEIMGETSLASVTLAPESSTCSSPVSRVGAEMGLLGGSKARLWSRMGSISDSGRLSKASAFVFLNSAAELIIFSSFSCGGFETLGLFSAAAGTSGSFEVDNSPTGTVCPFFSVLFWSGLLLISPSCSGISFNTPFLTSSALLCLTDNFLSKTAEVSLNFSLLFFFLHFHGLNILPNPGNFPFLRAVGVFDPETSFPELTGR